MQEGAVLVSAAPPADRSAVRAAVVVVPSPGTEWSDALGIAAQLAGSAFDVAVLTNASGPSASSVVTALAARTSARSVGVVGLGSGAELALQHPGAALVLASPASGFANPCNATPATLVILGGVAPPAELLRGLRARADSLEVQVFPKASADFAARARGGSRQDAEARDAAWGRAAIFLRRHLVAS